MHGINEIRRMNDDAVERYMASVREKIRLGDDMEDVNSMLEDAMCRKQNCQGVEKKKSHGPVGETGLWRFLAAPESAMVVTL